MQQTNNALTPGSWLRRSLPLWALGLTATLAAPLTTGPRPAFACDPAPPVVTVAPLLSAVGGLSTGENSAGTKPPGNRSSNDSIPVKSLLEFLQLATGKPVIQVATPHARQGRSQTRFDGKTVIPVISSGEPLTVPVVRALLAANGIGVEEFTLEGNVPVLLVRSDAQALAKVGRPDRGPNHSADSSAPEMARVDGKWSIEPDAHGWIILDIQHASPSSLRKAIDRMVNSPTLQVMEIGSRGQLLLDGPGEALTHAVQLVRFLDHAEIWSIPEQTQDDGRSQSTGLGSDSAPIALDRRAATPTTATPKRTARTGARPPRTKRVRGLDPSVRSMRTRKVEANSESAPEESTPTEEPKSTGAATVAPTTATPNQGPTAPQVEALPNATKSPPPRLPQVRDLRILTRADSGVDQSYEAEAKHTPLFVFERTPKSLGQPQPGCSGSATNG